MMADREIIFEKIVNAENGFIFKSYKLCVCVSECFFHFVLFVHLWNNWFCKHIPIRNLGQSIWYI